MYKLGYGYVRLQCNSKILQLAGFTGAFIMTLTITVRVPFAKIFPANIFNTLNRIPEQNYNYGGTAIVF